eukprot:CAMPEP_0172783770 /NCGR_PEP_ID=MMETSP1074-20121228/204601_1 /TAXON_ID=2916 /ORGANISM="Ceratium fusus, Strain PA161109" /LENGTH=1003 /DNA_ID=CAMNT_0013620769 /DNA_START=57 /DNA_END=3069 /DNA_ORIENTATION=+
MGDAGSVQQPQDQEAVSVTGNSVPDPTNVSMVVPPARQPGNDGMGAGQQLSEPALLAQLVQLLGQRPRLSLLLSDLGALLPGHLRLGVKERGGLRSWLQKFPELFLVSGQPGKESGHYCSVQLLSDLGALLPGHLRLGVKERGGLRSWLQKFPELFLVSGQPGKESVTLLLGAAGKTGIPAFPAGTPEMHLEHPPAGHIARDPALDRAAQYGSATEDGSAGRTLEDEENESAVQMRGLPYRATVADVLEFLGHHTKFLKDAERSVQLVLNRDGRPSGFARVQFCSLVAARAVRDALHMRTMVPSTGEGGPDGSRYVEIFLFSERPNKLRFKKGPTAGDIIAPGGACNDADDPDMPNATNDQVVAECRAHMESPGKGQLLLSMLGVALSLPARLYLKRNNQGLKHFLAQYPHEFSVEGAKGRECVTYLPAFAGGQENSDLPANYMERRVATVPAVTVAAVATPLPPAAVIAAQHHRRCVEGTGGPASGSIADLQQSRPSQPHRWENPGLIPESPKLTTDQQLALSNDTPKVLDTPSDWGTPQPGSLSMLQQLPAGLQRILAGGQDAAALQAAAAAPGVRDGLGVTSAIEATPCEFDSSHNTAAAIVATPSDFGGPAAVAAAAAVGQSYDWSAWAMPPPPMAYWQPAMVAAPGAASWATAPAAVGEQATGPLAAFNFATGPAVNAPLQASAPTLAPASTWERQMQQQQQQQQQQMVQLHLREPTHQVPQQLQAAPASTDACSLHVRLRGLPFTATEQDVLAFFAKHDIVDRVSEEVNAVRMLPPKASGKPSGQATVRMLGRTDVAIATQVLNGQYMGARYIEVFQDPDVEPQTAPGRGTESVNNSGLPQEAAERDTATLQQGALPKSLPLGRLQDTELGISPIGSLPLGLRQGNEYSPGDHCGLPDSPGDTGGSGGPVPVSIQNFSALGLLSNPHASQSLASSAGNKAPEQESSWEALYDFLKRGNGHGDPPLPSAAALHGLVGDGQEGTVISKTSTSGADATRV